MTENRRGIVFSTGVGRICPECGRPCDACVCRRSGAHPPADGIVRVRREVKGRGGKTVTTVSGLPLAGDALDRLASELKRLCGTGGTVKEGIVLIQGDRREAVAAELVRRGYTVRLAGG